MGNEFSIFETWNWMDYTFLSFVICVAIFFAFRLNKEAEDVEVLKERQKAMNDHYRELMGDKL
jgi:hypothetical protein